MPITKTDGEISYTQKADKWDSGKTGVFAQSDFAIASDSDPTKQLKFDPSGITEDSSITITAPAASGTLATLGVEGLQYAAPLTEATVVVAAGTTVLVLEPADTIAALTVTLPAGADGKVVTISSTEIVTALTLGATGDDTIVNAISEFAADGFVKYIYRASSEKWYRCG